jgi:hypothetical protein
VEEYYIYDPDTIELSGFILAEDAFTVVEDINGWISPRLGIRFQLVLDNLEIYYPDGNKFLTSVEFDQLAKQYNVSTEDIITHAMVAPGRKPDITDSQYKRILKYLKSRGYK